MKLLRSRPRPAIAAAVALGMCLSAATAVADQIRVGGTGMGLGLMQAIGEQFASARPGTRVEVLPSLGTSGGIKALVAKDIDVAIAANIPTPEQLALGLKTGACLKTALVFATSRPRAAGMTRAQLPELFANPAPSWPDGQPLKVILRARSGSENPYLIKVVPGMEAALATAYQRPGIPVGATDQDNVDYALRTAGSLAITTLLQIRTENIRLLPLSLDGVAPDATTLAAGTYPFPLDVCLLLRQQASADAENLIAFILSPEGQKLVGSFDALPTK